MDTHITDITDTGITRSRSDDNEFNSQLNSGLTLHCHSRCRRRLIRKMSLTAKTIPYSLPVSSTRTFIAQYGSTLSGQGLTLALGVLTGILSARLLGPVRRGEYAAITIWPMGIAGFLAFGINQAVVFYLGQREINLSEAATALTVIGLIQSAASVVIGLLVVPVVLAKYSAEVRHLGISFVLLTPALIY